MQFPDGTYNFSHVVALRGNSFEGQQVIAVMASDRAIDVESIKQRVGHYPREGIVAWAFVKQPFAVFVFDKSGSALTCNCATNSQSFGTGRETVSGGLTVENGRAKGHAKMRYKEKTAQVWFNAPIVDLNERKLVIE